MNNDMVVLQNLAPKIVNKPARNFIEPVTVEYSATRKTKITFALFGSWSIQMPPYGLARLVALTRASGYNTQVYDFNVQSYYDLKAEDPELAGAYEVANYWWWEEPYYSQKIFPVYQHLLQEYVDKILEGEPDIVGLSVYYTNILSTTWVVNEIKRRSPKTTIIFGGPQCNEGHFEKPDNVDYYFMGESEQTILDFLNNWENGIKPDAPKVGMLFGKVRVDIDSLPLPDYSSFSLYKYTLPNSICTELSRGCVARCTYCSEVWYWKFRDRDAIAIVDELEYQVKKYNLNFVFFVDSLVNGNVNGLKRFCEELIDRKLNIHWWAYARIDGRMDLDFYKLLKKSGCIGLNYGVESGSDKVLMAINKKNTVVEINQNLIDSQIAGMNATVCWVIGAPGEDIEAMNHSFNCVWNHRTRIFAISPGPGLGDNIGSAYDDRKKYNMNERDQYWLKGWYTLDFTNTRLHRYIRIKLMHIWLDLCNTFDGSIINSHTVGDIKKHYTVKFDDNIPRENVQYENFDYNIIESGFGVFADTSMNEVFGFLRILWRTKGAYEINIKFNPDLDYKSFAFCIDPPFQTYIADINFKIDAHGNYTVNNTYSFENLDRLSFIGDKDYQYTYTSSGTWCDPKGTVEKV